MSKVVTEAWPEEGTPEFAFLAEPTGGGKWVPLCECGSFMRLPAGHVQVWECEHAPVSHPGRIIWADEWPDYTEEDDLFDPNRSASQREEHPHG